MIAEELEGMIVPLAQQPARERFKEGAREALRAGLGGFFAEFGVYKGFSARRISRTISPEVLYGFDSFHGLPEFWKKTDKHGAQPGRFSLKGRPPTDVEPNVTLMVGLFEETIPKFLEREPRQASFFHVDCDLYSSTRTILYGLNDRIVPGTILLFDEMYPWKTTYTEWRANEFKALLEWCNEKSRTVVAIFHDGFEGVAFRVEK